MSSITGLGSAMQGVTSENLLDPKTTNLIAQSSLIALTIVAASIVAVIGWRFMIASIKSTDGQEGKAWDLMYVGRLFAIIAMIGIYNIAVPPIIGTIKNIQLAFTPGTETYQKFQQELADQKANASNEECGYVVNAPDPESARQLYVYLVKDKQMTPEQACQYVEQYTNLLSSLSSQDSDVGILQTLMIIMKFLLSGNIFTLFIYILVGFLSKIVKFVAYSAAFYTLKILLVLGPLAWAFSIFDFAKNQWRVHLNYTLNAAFIFVVFQLIDNFVMYNNQALASASVFIMRFDPTVPFDQIGFDLAIIALYLGAGKITSAVIGRDMVSGISNAATAVGGVAVAAVGMAAGATVGAAVGGAKGAATGAKIGGGAGNGINQKHG